MDAEHSIGLALWIVAIIRSATPLMIVTLGETLTQRAGVINLGIEGEMLAGACLGFAVAVTTGSPLLGLAAAMAAGAALSAVHALLVVGAGANQIASGIAVWTIALGATSYAGRAFVGRQVDPLPSLESLAVSEWDALDTILGRTSCAAPLALLLVLAAAWWLRSTRAGLAWRVTGESAAIAAENGLAPQRIRVAAILVGGALAGLGGGILSIDYTQTWAQEITKGQGFLAVGLVIVARWRPILVLPVCLLFGAADAAVLKLPAAGIALSSYLLASLPYLGVLALIILAQAGPARRQAMPADLAGIFR